MRKCICILCKNFDGPIKYIIERLYNQTSNTDIDLWIMLDENNCKETINNVNIWKFNWGNLFGIYNLNKYEFDKQRFYVGNCVQPLIEFSRIYDYDYYMFYENDMIYTDNIYELYNELTNEKYDAYFPEEFIRYSNDLVQPWIDCKNIVTKYPQDITIRNIYHHILNLYILSKESTNILYDELITKRWYGHHEWVIPSILKYYNMNINIFRNKLNDCCQYYKKYDLEYFINKCGPLHNSIYHPIKDIEIYYKILGAL